VVVTNYLICTAILHSVSNEICVQVFTFHVLQCFAYTEHLFPVWLVGRLRLRSSCGCVQTVIWIIKLALCFENIAGFIKHTDMRHFCLTELLYTISFIVICAALDETLTVTVSPGGRECFFQEISANSQYEIEYQVCLLANIESRVPYSQHTYLTLSLTLTVTLTLLTQILGTVVNIAP